VLRGDELVTVKEADRTEAQPLSRSFIAAMLRRAAETEEKIRTTWVSPEDVEKRIAEALAKNDADRREEWERAAQAELVDLRWKMQWAERFHEATGIEPGREQWLWGGIRRLVELLAEQRRGLLSPLQMIERSLAREVDALERAIVRAREVHAEVASIAKTSDEPARDVGM
jgi:hypothetical protein